MDLQTSLTELGLPADARPAEIEKAYKAQSRALKQLILSAGRAGLKEERRVELRRLVVCRATALGQPKPEDWRQRRYRISATRLIQRLSKLSANSLTHVRALGFFGLPPEASRETTLRVYEVHKRALVRRLATAESDAGLTSVRRARRKLRTIRNFALG